MDQRLFHERQVNRSVCPPNNIYMFIGRLVTDPSSPTIERIVPDKSTLAEEASIFTVDFGVEEGYDGDVEDCVSVAASEEEFEQLREDDDDDDDGSDSQDSPEQDRNARVEPPPVPRLSSSLLDDEPLATSTPMTPNRHSRVREQSVSPSRSGFRRRASSRSPRERQRTPRKPKTPVSCHVSAIQCRLNCGTQFTTDQARNHHESFTCPVANQVGNIKTHVRCKKEEVTVNLNISIWLISLLFCSN